MHKALAGATACALVATAAYAALPKASAPEDIHNDWTEDATNTYYNYALRLPWNSKMGTWRDANLAKQGAVPFAATPVVDRASEQVVQWDVTSLVRGYKADFLVKRSGGTWMKFHSKEAVDPAKRPRLIVWKDGEVHRYEPIADTSLTSSTIKSQGKFATVSTSGGFLIKFAVGGDTNIERAVLEMTATTEQYGNQTLSVFMADARQKYVPMPGFLRGTEADVALRLSGEAWKKPSFNSFRSDRMKINADGSLTVTIPTGADEGSAALYAIPKEARRATMYARAIMKVHGDWDAAMGGKYPGLSNTGQADRRASDICAWGGRLANGVCWSARTNRRPYYAGTPFADTHQALAPYAYRVNRSTSNGEGPSFNRPIEKGKYFVLDQMVKLNSIAADGTPNKDGLVAYWINGVLVGNMTGVVWRTRTGDDTLPSEYWLNVYEGGAGYVAPRPHSVTFKEVTVSTKLLPYDPKAVAALNAVGP
jgi:hypothetical protein